MSLKKIKNNNGPSIDPWRSTAFKLHKSNFRQEQPFDIYLKFLLFQHSFQKTCTVDT